jgi:hypothetical protein
MKPKGHLGKIALVVSLSLYALGLMVSCYPWQAASARPAKQNDLARQDIDRANEAFYKAYGHVSAVAEAEKEEEQLIGEAFGFANRTGAELLVTDANASENAAVVGGFTKAICAGSNTFDVRFVAHQSGGKKDNGRDTSHNFENLAGSVFHVVQGKVKADDTCLLVDRKYMKDKRPLPVKTTIREGDPASAVVCDAKTKGSLAKQRERAPVDCWQLAQIGENGRLLAVTYEPRQKGLLAALVLQIGDRRFVHEMPAQADSVSAWREGDGGKFDPTTLIPLFALQNERDDSWDVGILWAGEEGANLNVYRSSSASTLRKIGTGYRYWSPE